MSDKRINNLNSQVGAQRASELKSKQSSNTKAPRTSQTPGKTDQGHTSDAVTNASTRANAGQALIAIQQGTTHRTDGLSPDARHALEAMVVPLPELQALFADEGTPLATGSQEALALTAKAISNAIRNEPTLNASSNTIAGEIGRGASVKDMLSFVQGEDSNKAA